MIDLDTGWTPPESPPARSRRQRALSVGLAASLLLSLALGGSVETVPALRPVVSIPATVDDGFELAGDRLFVVAQSGGSTTIDAYRLPGGRRLWRATTPDERAPVQFDAAAGVLLTETQAAGAMGVGRIGALDAGTGRPLWQQEGVLLPSRFVARHVLITLPGVSGRGELWLVDARTGARMWSSPIDEGDDDAVTDSGVLVLRSTDGAAQAVDENTGRVLATGRLPGGGPDPGPPASGPAVTGVVPQLFAAGDLLFVTSPRATGTVLTAYAAGTFARRWQITVNDTVRTVTDCGPVLCLNGDQAITAIDPETGGTRWRDLASIDGTGANGWLRANAPNHDGFDSHIVVLDPVTGNVALDLGVWSPVTQNGTGAPPLLVRSQAGRLGTWVAGAGASGIRPEGWLSDAIAAQCQLTRSSDRTYLACATRAGPVRVWAYRPV